MQDQWIKFEGLEAQYLIDAIDAAEKQLDSHRAAFKEDIYVIMSIEERRKILQSAKQILNKIADYD